MLVEMDSNTNQLIFIPLLNEGTDVLRSTLAEHIEADIYRVLPADNYDPEDEAWMFLPYTLVKCKKENHRGEYIFIAYDSVLAIT